MRITCFQELFVGSVVFLELLCGEELYWRV